MVEGKRRIKTIEKRLDYCDESDADYKARLAILSKRYKGI